jgi:hypothetical protein
MPPYNHLGTSFEGLTAFTKTSYKHLPNVRSRIASQRLQTLIVYTHRPRNWYLLDERCTATGSNVVISECASVHSQPMKQSIFVLTCCTLTTHESAICDRATVQWLGNLQESMYTHKQRSNYLMVIVKKRDIFYHVLLYFAIQVLNILVTSTKFLKLWWKVQFDFYFGAVTGVFLWRHVFQGVRLCTT